MIVVAGGISGIALAAFLAALWGGLALTAHVAPPSPTEILLLFALTPSLVTGAFGFLEMRRP